MPISPTFRPATQDDSSHLAILLDAASRRLVSWLWSRMAAPGQSWFEVGRERIRTNKSGDSHYSNWQIAEADGRILGGLNTYKIADPYDAGDLSGVPEVLHSIIELEALAAGAHFIQVASVFPEFRGKGVGAALLAKAEAIARAAGSTRLALLVESFNDGALRLYLRSGFVVQARRPLKPTPLSDESGDFILLVKELR